MTVATGQKQEKKMVEVHDSETVQLMEKWEVVSPH